MFDFLSAKKTIDGVKQNYRAQFQQRLEIQNEIVQVRNASTHRDDICKIAAAWVDRSALDLGGALAKRFENTFSHGETTPVEVGLFALLELEPRAGTLRALDSVMCRLFGAEIKRALTDAIKSMPVENEGLPQVERAAKLAKLQAREVELTAELAKLVKAADESGIEL